jgi:hypothetical protein
LLTPGAAREDGLSLCFQNKIGQSNGDLLRTIKKTKRNRKQQHRCVSVYTVCYERAAANFASCIKKKTTTTTATTAATTTATTATTTATTTTATTATTAYLTIELRVLAHETSLSVSKHDKLDRLVVPAVARVAMPQRATDLLSCRRCPVVQADLRRGRRGQKGRKGVREKKKKRRREKKKKSASYKFFFIFLKKTKKHKNPNE